MQMATTDFPLKMCVCTVNQSDTANQSLPPSTHSSSFSEIVSVFLSSFSFLTPSASGGSCASLC